MTGKTMTIGDLARRTGTSVKVLRRQHDLGLIYDRGRSPGGYRLFDDDALWCVGVIATLRSVGLTETEIAEFAATATVTGTDPDARLLGPRLAELLERSRARIGARIDALRQQRDRLDRFTDRYRDALAGDPVADAPWGSDPRPRQPSQLYVVVPILVGLRL